MKNYLLSIIAILLVVFYGNSQPGIKLVPKPVLDQFAKDFPGVSAKRWELKPGKQHEAVLMHNNMHCRARYYANGEKHFTSYSYSAANVPQNISAVILNEFKDFKVKHAVRVINHKKNTDRYWVRLTKPGFVLKALVNADGTFAFEDDDEFDIQDRE